MIWKFITFFVRKLDPEIAHKITIKFLKLGLHPRLSNIVISIKVGNLIFSAIYPLYLNRIEKNERTKEELNQLIEWLTGFDEEKLQTLIENKVTFKTFFKKAKIHSNAKLIKGVVCGYRIEEIDDEFEVYKRCRQMEKLIDELAKGRKMEKILRK